MRLRFPARRKVSTNAEDGNIWRWKYLLFDVRIMRPASVREVCPTDITDMELILLSFREEIRLILLPRFSLQYQYFSFVSNLQRAKQRDKFLNN